MADFSNTYGVLGVVLMLAVCGGGSRSYGAGLPAATIPVCTAPPRIDGAPDDACWKQALVVDRFHVLGTADGLVTKHRAWVIRDNSWLYVAFDIAHPAADRDPPKYFKHDDLVQREDCVKVSFDPGTEGKVYFHFKMNRINVRQERRMSIEKGSEVHGWNIPWRSATEQTERGWTAEIALPFSLMLTHGDTRKASMNLVATIFRRMVDQQHVKLGVKRQDISWGPLRSVWNEPERFVKLRDLEHVEFRAPFLPFLSKAQVTGYEMAGGQCAYGVSANLQSMSGTGGRVRLTVTDRPSVGAGQKAHREIDLEANSTVPVQIAVPVKSLVKRTAILSMSDLATGERMQSIDLDETSALDLFDAYLDRSYYTSEEHAVAVCRIGLPAEGLTEMTLTARDARGAVIARAAELGSLKRFRIPVRRLEQGRNTIAVELGSQAAGVVSSLEVQLLKKAPKSGFEWKIDRVNRMLLKDGEPFFPFGFIMSGINPDAEWAFREIAEAGFNTAFQWQSRRDPETGPHDYLTAAARHNLHVVTWPAGAYSRFGKPLTDPEGVLRKGELDAINKALRGTNGTLLNMKGLTVGHPALTRLSRRARSRFFAEHFENNLPRLVAGIRNSLDHPNLIGINTFDEPCTQHFDQDVQGRRLHKLIHELDGYHPTFLLYSSEIPPGRRCIDWCDVLGTDPYWVPAGTYRNNVNFVSKIVARTKARADELRNVTYTVPMAEYWSGCRKRAVHPREQRCQTYLALIHGTKAIFYFKYPVMCKASFDALSDLASQMRVLGPLCLTPDVEQEVRYSPGVLDAKNGKFTDVQVSLRESPNGGHVLLCANSRYFPVDTTFKVSLLGRKGTVGRLFADDAYAATDSAFSDRIEGHGTRAYLIKGKRNRGEPVRISVTMQPHKDLAEAEAIAFTTGYRTGRKNLMPNPSFEDVSIPGWPDYYRYTGTGMSPDERIGAPGQVWGSSVDRPFHGRRCIKMEVKADKKDSRVNYIYFRFDKKAPAEYVFSIYARANRDGVKLRWDLRPPGAGAGPLKFITLTKEWQRYDETFAMQPAPNGYFQFFAWLLGYEDDQRDGVVWLDAFQLERGSEATGFEP